MTQVSNRHHYIPRFYTKLWTDAEGKLCEFSRPYQTVVPQRKAPKAVGFSLGLYDLLALKKEHRSFLEDTFFAQTDQEGCEAINVMLHQQVTDLTAELRSGFSRLLTSFHHRTPDRIAFLRASFDVEIEQLILRLRPDQDAFRSYEDLGFSRGAMEDRLREYAAGKSWGDMLMSITDSKEVNQAIMNMRWFICDLSGAKHTLLTSDKPLVSTNGFAHADGHLCLALGPNHIFVATNNQEEWRQISGLGRNKLVADYNDRVVKQAVKYAYANNDTQLRFVNKRLALQLSAVAATSVVAA